MTRIYSNFKFSQKSDSHAFLFSGLVINSRGYKILYRRPCVHWTKVCVFFGLLVTLRIKTESRFFCASVTWFKRFLLDYDAL